MAAASPEDVVQQSVAVVTMLPNSSHVREVYGKMLQGVADGGATKAFIDSSTIDPGAARDVSVRV